MPAKNTAHNIGGASQIGQYSDAIETAAPGPASLPLRNPWPCPRRPPPNSFEGQADQAWKNVFTLLAQANMGPEHLVKVSQYLTRAEDIPLYKPIRSKWLGDNHPAFLLAVVPRLVRPEFLIEIEAYAVAPVTL